MTFSICTWNINSARLRVDSIKQFLSAENPDILCLQEIKCLPEQFPGKAFEELGYVHVEVNGQKAYHGAATISKVPLTRLDTEFCPRDEARHVSTGVNVGPGFELHNFYVPAGGDEANVETNPKFAHKLDFLGNMIDYFGKRAKAGDVGQVIVGDFNIAPHEHDVWSHKQLLRVVSHTPVEVEILGKLQAAHDFTDCARHFARDTDKLFSWWSYRARDVMKSNRGRRLDHIWVSPKLVPAIDGAGQDSHEIHVPVRIWEKPSDHVPVMQKFKF